MINNKINIQWFPGHMAKTKRILGENLKLVDIVIELLDARIPYSSKNPDIDGLIKNKPKIVVLNKSDLADLEVSKKWAKYFRDKGQEVVFIDSIKGSGIKELNSQIKSMMKEKWERNQKKGIIAKPVRTMVVGIPNVGKSAFINKIAGIRFPWWHSGLRIWCCHCCGLGSTPGLGTGLWVEPKKKMAGITPACLLLRTAFLISKVNSAGPRTSL